MSPIALLLALPVVLAGAWYVVNPHNVARLAELEGTPANRSRRRLRRANGGVMILAGVALYFAVSRVLWLTDETALEAGRRPGVLLPLACLALVPLLVAMLALAWADVRLTRRMKRRAIGKGVRDSRQGPQNDAGAALVVATLAVTLAGCDDPPPPAPPSSVPTPMAQVSPTADQTDDSPNAPQTRPSDPPAESAEIEEPQPQTLPTIELTLGGEAFTLMVANDDEERATGLMYRRELGANEGMLFVFPDRDWRGFWMRNTHVPLDILFLDEKARILNIEAGQPYSERSVRSAGRCQYVIEIARGRSRELGLGRGDVIDLPAEVREAEQ